MARSQAQPAWLEQGGQEGPWGAMAQPGGPEQLRAKIKRDQRAGAWPIQSGEPSPGGPYNGEDSWRVCSECN